MTLSGLAQQKFIEVLKGCGLEILDSTYWESEGVERIVMGKEGHTFAFKLKQYYYSGEVVKRCNMFGITPENCPEELKEELAYCFGASTSDLVQINNDNISVNGNLD